MREIPLTQGKVALVDDEDYDRVMAAGPWQAHKTTGSKTFYATRSVYQPVKHTVYMHSFISGYDETDHKNHDTLDNRGGNLRDSSRNQNTQNRGKPKNNTSGYKGVSWHKHWKKWQAYISVDRKRIYLGYYADSWEAALAYDEAAKKYHGEFAQDNFFGVLTEEVS